MQATKARPATQPLPDQQNRLEAILGRFRAILEASMSESERERWLSGLKPGDEATVVCACGRYPVTVAAVGEETIALEASGLPPGMLWVWRQTGMRPDWRCYIRPTDAPADYPSPLDALESMLEAA